MDVQVHAIATEDRRRSENSAVHPNRPRYRLCPCPRPRPITQAALWRGSGMAAAICWHPFRLVKRAYATAPVRPFTDHHCRAHDNPAGHRHRSVLRPALPHCHGHDDARGGERCRLYGDAGERLPLGPDRDRERQIGRTGLRLSGGIPAGPAVDARRFYAQPLCSIDSSPSFSPARFPRGRHLRHAAGFAITSIYGYSCRMAYCGCWCRANA